MSRFHMSLRFHTRCSCSSARVSAPEDNLHGFWLTFGSPVPEKRVVSPAARRRMAAGQRKRWAAVKGVKQPAPKKRKVSAAGRKRIAEATRKRWAEFRAKKAAAK